MLKKNIANHRSTKMAKKYHQTHKDRMDESRGMKKYEEKMHDMSGSFVEGNDPEIGRDSFAGMPSNSMMKMYPKNKMRKGGSLDDSMRNIDAIQTDSEDQIMRHLSNQK